LRIISHALQRKQLEIIHIAERAFGIEVTVGIKRKSRWRGPNNVVLQVPNRIVIAQREFRRSNVLPERAVRIRMQSDRAHKCDT